MPGATVTYITPKPFRYHHCTPSELYTLSLHDALPISPWPETTGLKSAEAARSMELLQEVVTKLRTIRRSSMRSEEHTSELQSRQYLVCRLLLEKKKKDQT